MIVCNVRPHLSLRLGAASILPFLRGIVTPARVQPSCLLSLLLLKTVSERRASARITVTSKGVACDASRSLHVAVFLRLLSQSRVSVRVASSVALETKRVKDSHLSTSQHRAPRGTLCGIPQGLHADTSNSTTAPQVQAQPKGEDVHQNKGPASQQQPHC